MGPKYSHQTWFSPRFAILLLWQLREKYGEQAIRDNKYQKEREAWVVAVALLGVIKMTQVLWWLQIPEEDPPDILAMTVTPDKEKAWNVLNHRKVEVMEITKFTNLGIVEEILIKLKSRQYEKETGLVVYLRRDTSIPDMRDLSKQLSGKINQVSDIWIVGNTKPDTNDFILFSIFPDVQVVNYNLDEEIAKLPRGDILDLSRAKGTKIELVTGVFPAVFNPRRKRTS